jgi:DNA polymerase
MSAKAELYEIARELREYIAWHAQTGAAGSVPASSEQRMAFQALQKRREDRKLAEARRELMEEEERSRPPESKAPQRSEAKAEGGSAPKSDNPAENFREQFEEATNEKPAEKLDEDDSDDQPWKRFGSRPKPRFAGKKKAEKKAEMSGSGTPSGQPSQKPSTLPPEATGPQYDENAYPEASGMMMDGAADIDDSSSEPARDTPARPKAASTKNTNDAKDDMSKAEKLEFLVEYLGDCRRCGLCENRTNIVFGDGDAEAKLVFVGEAPGYNEDKQGLPFVGDAGQLLDKMINAMGLEREDVYICNVIKCRPPKNRNPHPDEIQECSPFLRKQLEAISPTVIVSLGKFASQFLLDSDESIGRMRGQWHEWEGIPVMPTYHPAYLLRQESQKRKTWNDLQMVMERLGL